MRNYRRFRPTAFGGTLILAGLCAGVSWAQRPPAPPSEVKLFLSGEDAEKALTQKGLAGLISILENQPKLILPSIHSQSYCGLLPESGRSRCNRDNKFGQHLFKAIRKYQLGLKSLPPHEFGRSLKRMARLRDSLWQSRSMGGIVLADLANRIIYWRLSEQMTVGPLDKLSYFDTLRPNYIILIADWKMVARAAGEELGHAVDITKIEDSLTHKRPPRKGDYRLLSSGASSLALRYQDVTDQLESEINVAVDKEDGSDETALSKVSMANYLLFLPVQSCSLESAPLVLGHYPNLMRKMRRLPEFSKGLISPPTSPKLQASTVQLRQRFQKLIPQLIPKVMEQKLVGCKKGLTWFDFQRLIALVEILENARFSDPVSESDAQFESRFP